MGIHLSKLDKKDYFVLLLGLLLVVKIRVIGTFSISEILLFLTWFSPSMRKYHKDRNVKKMISYAILWLIGTIISNLVNHTEMMDSLKGVFFVLILIMIIPPVYGLVQEKPERVLLFYIGSGISALYGKYFAATEGIRESLASDVYQFYAYAAFVGSIVFVLYYKGKRKLAILIMEAMAVVTLFHASRNFFLNTSIAAIILLIILNGKGSINAQRISFKKKIPVVLMFGLIAAFGVSVVYEDLASNGVLGEAAYEKYVRQSQGGNLLEGGRQETFMGIELITMKPIFGWGSYAKDTWGFKAKYAAKHGREYHDFGYDPELPAHSHVVNAWMQNGILGGLFWFFIIIMMAKAFISGSLLYEPRILGLLVFKCVAEMWDWAFSPFGDRVSFCFIFLTLLAILFNYQSGLYFNNKVAKLAL